MTRRVSAVFCVFLLACATAVAASEPEAVSFVQITTVAELDRELQNLEGRPALLKVSSDWSISGGEMDKHFATATLRNLLQDVVLLAIDVTDHTEDDQEFLAHYDVVGTPWILLFDKNGEHLADKDIAGYENATGLAERIKDAFYL